MGSRPEISRDELRKLHREYKATTDPELISDYIAEALGVLQIDNTEEDAFHMLGSAIVDAVAEDEEHAASLFEVWTDLEEQWKLS